MKRLIGLVIVGLLVSGTCFADEVERVSPPEVRYHVGNYFTNTDGNVYAIYEDVECTKWTGNVLTTYDEYPGNTSAFVIEGNVNKNVVRIRILNTNTTGYIRGNFTEETFQIDYFG